MKEIYKDIKGFEGYEISNKGKKNVKGYEIICIR